MPIVLKLRKSCEIVRENEESCEGCDFFLNNEKVRKKWRASLGKGYTCIGCACLDVTKSTEVVTKIGEK